jgi:hypothetical protein
MAGHDLPSRIPSTVGYGEVDAGMLSRVGLFSVTELFQPIVVRREATPD